MKTLNFTKNALFSENCDFSLFSQNHRFLDRPGGQNLRDRVKVSASGAEMVKFHLFSLKIAFLVKMVKFT